MNFDSLQSMAGQNIAIKDLAELNKALQASGQLLAKSDTVGYQTASSGGGNLAPLVPQSIQNTLDSATYTDNAIVFWKKLAKVSVTNTIHESAVVNAYGTMQLDPFIAEGEVGPTSVGEYEKKIVQIKYLAERREISDVATMVGMIGATGVSAQGLAQQTMDGTKALLGKLERTLFNANSQLSGLQYDGLEKQILGASVDTSTGIESFSNDTHTDLEGGAATAQDIVQAAYQAAAAPNFGAPNVCMVEPRTYAGLVNLASAYGRFDPNQAAAGSLIFGTNGLQIAGPAGMVPIVPAPLMQYDDGASLREDGSTGFGDTTFGENVPANPGTITYAAGAADSAPKFRASDAGTYIYRFQPVNDKGVGKFRQLSATVQAGKSATFTFSDSGEPVGSGTNGLSYYRVYRTEKDGSKDTARYIGSWPRNASGNTVIVDENERRPNTAPIYILQLTPDVMYWAQLLDFLRRPLAQDKTTIPFLLMLFGSLHVKIPTKNHILRNCKLGF